MDLHTENTPPHYTGCTASHVCWLPRILATPAHTSPPNTTHVQADGTTNPLHGAPSQPVQWGTPVSLGPLLGYGQHGSMPQLVSDPCCAVEARYVDHLYGVVVVCAFIHCSFLILPPPTAAVCTNSCNPHQPAFVVHPCLHPCTGSPTTPSSHSTPSS